MESDDVAAVSVLRTGESAMRVRKTRMQDLTAFAPETEDDPQYGQVCRVHSRDSLRVIADTCSDKMSKTV